LYNPPENFASIEDPDSPVVRFVFYLFSMETWVQEAINTASRNGDRSKIATLGPFCMIMGDIMSLAPKFRTELEPRVFSHSGVTLYRGSTQSHAQIEELKFAACPDIHPQTGIPVNRNRDTDDHGNIIALNLYGFISTSVDREFAE
jgi:hypothetical protein